MDPLLPQRLLFRFAAPCHFRETLWDEPGAGLEERFRLIGLAELEGKPVWADVRAAWNESGLMFTVSAPCKQRKNPPSIERLEENEGLHIWLDTRSVHNVHRATRFCHRFFFLAPLIGEDTPALKEGKLTTVGPMADRSSGGACGWLPINRARENPRPIPAGSLRRFWQATPDGYLLATFISAAALTGFDPAEYPRLGFNYAVFDREFGCQTFSAGPPLPYQEDPSLWATLELVR